MFLETQKNDALNIIDEKLNKLKKLSKDLKDAQLKYTQNIALRTVGMRILWVLILAWLIAAPFIMNVLSANVEGLSEVRGVITAVLYIFAVYPILYGAREMFVMPRVQQVEFYQHVVTRLSQRLKKMKDKLDDLFEQYLESLDERRAVTIKEQGDIDTEIERIEAFLESNGDDFSPTMKRVISLVYFFSTLLIGVFSTILIGSLIADIVGDDSIMVAAPVVFITFFGGLHLLWMKIRMKINLLSYILSIFAMALALLLCASPLAEIFPILVVVFIFFWISSLQQRSKKKK